MLDPKAAQQRHLNVKHPMHYHDHPVDLSPLTEAAKMFGLDEVAENAREFLDGIQDQMADDKFEYGKYQKRSHPFVGATSATFQEFNSFE